MARANATEAIGRRLVAQIVREPWRSDWQEFDQQNDDGIDGIALLRRRDRVTGRVLYLQVKTGDKYLKQLKKDDGKYLRIDLGRKHLEKHKPRWACMPGPTVLIYVNPKKKPMPDAWWCDLKKHSSYDTKNKGIVLVPRAQRFGIHSKGDFMRLCGTGPDDRGLPEVTLTRADVAYVPLSGQLRIAAKREYARWSGLPADMRMNPTLGQVDVSRVGWRHMTRRGRSPERVVQSWLLLGAARKIVKTVKKVDILGHARVTALPGGGKDVRDYVGLRANVFFPHRHTATIQVVIRRKRVFGHAGNTTSRCWFYSIFEVRRGLPGA